MAERAFALTPLGRRARFSLRGGATVAQQAGLGLALGMPVQACRSTVRGDRAALWLGPDEWLLLAPFEEGGAIAARLAEVLRGIPHSLVDVGHRSIGFSAEGSKVCEVLNAGCPLDLHPSAFPVGMCTRTLLGKAEVVLWRIREDAFHLEVARSFANYVAQFLKEASLQYEVETRPS
jgi:sarcosine oxidase, subunit gamma